MIRHYHSKHGVRRTHWKRNFSMAVATITLLSIPAVVIFNDISPSRLIKESASASTQASFLSSGGSASKLHADLPWPNYGHAAYGMPEREIYATSSDDEKAVPIASLAKIITALAILEEKPLQRGEQGPNITLTERDVALFGEYLSKDGVVVPVEVGERISEYQALQAVLHVSANNMSDSLATWAFGSVEDYVTYANKMLVQKGFTKTVVADASGFSPQTVSTAEEMTRLGYLYMQHPVLREIAMQNHGNIPLAGVINNANSFANEEGIYGVKIGHTDEAGRTYMAARIQKDGGSSEVISVSVVLGADSLDTAARDAVAVLKAGDNAKQP